MEDKKSGRAMVVLSFAVLPYQKKRLSELSEQTKKPMSELGREALSYLFTQYQKMGY